MNKKTVALSSEDYKNIITTIQQGFTYTDANSGKEKKFRPNVQLATALQIEANVGVRISDVLSLTMASMVKDGNRHRLDIVERKTGKARTFTVPDNVYSFLSEYAMNRGIGKHDKLFTVGERAIQKQLAIVCDYLHIERVSTHSFRKTFATNVYENSGCNIELARQLLQHSSTATTQRYIGISTKQIENALQGVTNDLLIG